MDDDTSRPMVGRSAEAAILRDAFGKSSRGDAAVVVVSGEAGIGKSRLVDEFIAGLPDDTPVARGQCVDLRDLGAPLIAIRAIMSDLAARFGADRVRGAAGDPSIDAALTGGSEDAAGIADRGANRLPEAFARALVVLSDAQPLVIVVEDLHWADNATLAVIDYAARVLRSAHILLVGTVRTGELPRGHRLRTELAELARVRSVAHIALQPLGRDEVAALIAAVGADVNPDILLRRSGGVPYFAEELLRSPDAAVPATLGELLLSRYEAAGEPAKALLRVIAIGGERVDHALLDAVVRKAGTVDDAARDAIARGLLVADDAGYAFRHALVREVLLGEILPGERARLHARWAEALAASRRRDAAAETSTHWLAAGRLGEAFAAAVAAMDEAERALAPVMLGAMAERCVDLWNQVEDAAAVAGTSLFELVVRGIDAYRTGGRGDLAIALADRGLVVEDEPVARAWLLYEKSFDMGKTAGLDPGDAIAEGLAVVEGRQDPDALLVHGALLVNRAAEVMLGGAMVDAAHAALAAMEECLAAGRRGAPYASMAANIAATSMSDRPDRWSTDEVFAMYDRARELAGDHWPAQVRLAINESDTLLRLGRFEAAAREAEAALAEVAVRGEQRWSGVMLTANAVDALIGTGEWARARALVEETLRLEASTWFRAYLENSAIFLLVWDDRLDEAEELLHRVEPFHRSLVGSLRQVSRSFAFAECELMLARDDPAAALARARAELDPARTEFRGGLLRIVHDAARAWRMLADAGAPTGIHPDDLRRVVADEREGVTVPVWRALIEGELAASVAERIEELARAADMIAEGGAPRHLRGYALVRRAALLRQAGMFDEAAAVAAEGVAEAERIGARLIVREARRLVPERPAAHGLTRRERQVLDLVAQGLTNRQIAERLFMSEKTASVHVSAILRKLGVPTRSAAAGMAAGLAATPADGAAPRP